MTTGRGSEKKDPHALDSQPVTLLTSAVEALLVLDAPSQAGWPSTSSPGEVRPEQLDRALVDGIRRGDRKLGAALYARLGRVIDRTLVRVLGPNQPDHDDWVQAVFEEVIRSIRAGRFQQRCSLTSWAASVACHVGLNAIRSRKTERAIFDRQESSEAASGARAQRDALGALEARDELRLIRGLLAQISPGRAEAVLLHDALGYSLNEVAELTGSTPTAVQSRLARGRQDLAERLSELRRQEGDR